MFNEIDLRMFKDVYKSSTKILQIDDIKQKSVTFLPYWTFWLDLEKSGKQTNEQANLAHYTCIF
jgi:hypothetical protein